MGDGTLSALGRAAVWYCEHGFAIFPLKPRSKEPATAHGLNDWFDNPSDARELWGRFPDYNIGIACGAPSHGLLVLDLDVSEDRDGRETLRAWERAHGELPETAMAVTGGGGRHYLYRTDRTNIRPSANRELGVDVRCDGSYIVAPPSIHPSGAAYEWWEHPEDTPVATADASVYDFLDHVQRNGGEDEERPQAERFELPERIRKGERDNTLYRYGCSLRGRGYPDDVILGMLDHANRERCAEPLDYRDVRRIARSVCSKGPGHDGHGSYVGEGPQVGPPGQQAIVGTGDGDPLPNFRTDRGAVRPNLLGQIVIRRNHARLIDGAPAVWTGSRWEFGKRAVNRVSLGYADDITKAQKDEVYSYVFDKAPSVTTETSFDRCHYVQFSNATFDVMAQQVVEPNYQMLVTATLPVDLDLDAPHGDADRFLESLAGGDEIVVRVLEEVVGACMCSRRVLSQSPMLIGRGGGAGSTASNGKSTFLNVLRALLGPDNVSSLDIATLGQRFQAGRVVGKLANLGDDIPDGFLRGDELSTFKKLVTGDQIYTDVKNGEGYEFRPSATFVFSMNAMPRLADTTDGVFRRLAFVPFRNHFAPGEPGYDPGVLQRMTKPENLRRLAVLGLMALPDLIVRGSLTEVPDMVEEVESVRIDNDIVRRWMYDECVEARELDGRWVADVYKEFSRWCERNGERFGASQRTFTTRLLATDGYLNTYVTRNREEHKQARKFRWQRKEDENSSQA